MMASYVLMKKEPFPVEVVNNLVFHFFLPVTTFSAIARLQTLPAGELLLVTASGFVAMCATYLFAILTARLCGLGDRFRKTFLLGASYGNHIFLGVPICYAFLGERGTVPALFFALGGYLFLYGVGIYIMTGRTTPAAIFKNPLILAMVAGILCVALRIPLPSLLSHTFSLMNTATFPLSMVVVGGGLKLRFFIDSTRIVHTLYASGIKLLVSPLIAWGICLVLGMTRDQLEICVLQSAMPTAVLVTIFSVKYDADPVFSNAIVSLTTLTGMATIPALFFLLK
ncbi:MAG: auxin efflux carrier family protein, partial [Deltaproteobacteria bacterium]|nr:auxin efflux carrier family protein [Deltaproteobacteria bacterium]